MSNKSEIIITGIQGFVGGHIATIAANQGYVTYGLGREDKPNDRIKSLVTEYTQVDLMDRGSLDRVSFKSAAAIIHLAGLASVAESFEKPEQYMSDNAIMTNNILSVAHEQGFTGRAIIVSTGALYDANQHMPLNEASAISENSPYAIGKIRAEKVAKDFRSQGMDVVIARPFNHVGPDQGPGFLVPDLYEQLVKASADSTDEILVGNLATKRDYTDVRDIAKAYLELVSSKSLNHDTYNICSGKSISGLDVLNILKDSMNLTDIDVKIDQSKVRPTDAMDIIGDNSRIKGDTGWSPQSSADQAIRDFVSSKS